MKHLAAGLLIAAISGHAPATAAIKLEGPEKGSVHAEFKIGTSLSSIVAGLKELELTNLNGVDVPLLQGFVDSGTRNPSKRMKVLPGVMYVSFERVPDSGGSTPAVFVFKPRSGEFYSLRVINHSGQIISPMPRKVPEQFEYAAELAKDMAERLRQQLSPITEETRVPDCSIDAARLAHYLQEGFDPEKSYQYYWAKDGGSRLDEENWYLRKP